MKSSRWERCCVPLTGALRDALMALERGGVEIALVVGADNQLVGTLTDGDVRRALLRGTDLNSPLQPYIQRQFTAVDPSTSRAEVLDLMQARTLGQIPIVDSDGKLRGLHRLHEVIGHQERTNWAVVMAGGRGTRLGPLTENLPKPMLRVAGRPILERVVLHLVGQGFRRIFLSINYLGHIVEEHFGDGRRFGCRIDYLRETQPLGTCGALALLPEPPSEPIVLMNGDLVTQADLSTMLEFHKQGGFGLTVGVREYTHTVPFGCVEVDGDRLVGIKEKPLVSRLMNAGIYVVEPACIHRIPRDQEFHMTSLVERVLDAGVPAGAFEIRGDWVDVGRREQLREARGELA